MTKRLIMRIAAGLFILALVVLSGVLLGGIMGYVELGV